MKKETLLMMVLAFVGAVAVKAQKKTFEGEFHFVNTVTVDKTMQKMYKWARSGEYKMDFVRRGEDEYCSETYGGTHCIILRSKDEGYVWSPLLKKGYKFKWSDYKAYCDKIHQNNTIQSRATGDTKDINGYPCRRYVHTESGQTELMGAKIVTTEEKDYWVCEDYPAEYMASTVIPGMPFYYEENSRIKLPLLGEASQHQLLEMVAVTERKVEDSELTPPADIQFTFTKDAYGAQNKLIKEIYKYKKKNGIEDDGVKEDGVSREKGEWDF